jgi:proteasome accessory factor A
VKPCKKVLGADFELSNAIESAHSRRGQVSRAARLLLDEIDGYPRRDWWGGTSIEWGRRFLASNGGSAYIDSDHLEINLPEHTRAADHAAQVHAGLRLAHEAQVAAQNKLDSGERLHVNAAVSDGQASWGHHLNVTVSRQAFADVFARKPHLAGFLATHLATATLYAGQGAVGAGNERPACDYQLSQRADWFEEFAGPQTMQRRPLLNLRDEPHAGPAFARMHLIYFDRVLCPTANLLMAGATQLVLALIEAGWADTGLLLDDPLGAVSEVSRDLTLARPLAMAKRGLRMSAVEVQRALAELAGEFVASGDCGDAVPGAETIVARWLETLDLLARRDLAALSRRCDWALKYLLLDRLRGRKGLTWDSAELKSLDLRYSSVDPTEGLFWQMAAAGQVEDMPSAEQVRRCLSEPPDDSRAYLRAHVLHRFGEHVSNLDWDEMRFRLWTDSYWRSVTTLPMPDPAAFGKEQSEPLLKAHATVHDLVVAVRQAGGVKDDDWPARSGMWVTSW